MEISPTAPPESPNRVQYLDRIRCYWSLLQGLDGRAQLDTLEVDGPTGHIEGLTLRMYDPQSHLWRLYWANSKNGIMDPPQIGEFKNGRGEFFAQDAIDGKSLLIRFACTDMTTNSPHFDLTKRTELRYIPIAVAPG
jgi:hypothetical protein